MARERKIKRSEEPSSSLHPEAKKSVFAIIFIGLAVILLLASFKQAGPAGNFFYRILNELLGWGYYLLPTILLLTALTILTSKQRKIFGITLLGALLFIISGLGLMDLLSGGAGGLIGRFIGALEIPFGKPASLVITITLLIASVVVTLNVPLKFPKRKPKEEKPKEEYEEIEIEEKPEEETEITITKPQETLPPKKVKEEKKELSEEIMIPKKAFVFKNYAAPPLDLLKSFSEKPTIGDLRANANIIKRTLEGFGIPVEMGEITVGPAVTRYTLKPAEGIKLSRITGLNQDLALTLASHPIRIEAPIPGKSLVGIEVPNKAAALVRLGGVMASPEFQNSGLLGFVLGRDVEGKAIFANIDKMPHLLIAGATGSGKSVIIHSLLVSLLYKNSPSTLKMILIDPKRVELSNYDGIPHLIAPVITESKLAINVFRWAISEMERRYKTLLESGSRDIQSYNAKKAEEPMPYLLIVIDELADLMVTYGREVESLIIRLAQMARATGLHLVVSTQRPSVEVVTGLIKANITSRIALQVASQVDSRTILDVAGAEKLLGRGDLLFVSAEFSKPKRIQSCYVSEEEIKKVINFIKTNNKPEETIEQTEGMESPSFNNGQNQESPFDIFNQSAADDDDDELLDEAIEVVKAAQKASASLLQRRLKVGYARAARLLDIMENKGLIGPGEGAKPREIYLDQVDNSDNNPL
jgi:S-DNA-T family DNA segregation ATPase FtsK/SpoIIIE